MSVNHDDFKHACKFCEKCFPCGRSLGGHMRSHMTNLAHNSTEFEDNLCRKKGVFVDNGGYEAGFDSGSHSGYVLRENPRKSWRIGDHGNSSREKFCKFCAKWFDSSKSFFDHMRSHSEEKCFDEDEEEDSWVMDSQSDTEAGTRNRRRRSMRKKIKYVDCIGNQSSSVSEVEHEQEEVAKCLMMLSRDVGHWGSTASSDTNSMNRSNGGTKSASKFIDFDIFGDGYRRNGSKTESGCDQNGEFDSQKYSSSLKRKLRYESMENSESGFRKISHKKNKFECATCNKVFHSYQALGGHRASHKKIKGCFASKADGRDDSLGEDEFSVPASPIHRVKKVEEVNVGSKKGKSHECPICLRVFSSGQALGGHKRSHVVGGGGIDSRSTQTIVIEKPIATIRDLLDLNLPAPVEDESSEGVGLEPWWLEPTKKHKPRISLISN